MLNKRADKLELLRIAEAVALEKSIDKELIISSMETGIAKAAKSKFGQENEIKVSINRDNGDIELFRKLIISENPGDPMIQPEDPGSRWVRGDLGGENLDGPKAPEDQGDQARGPR